MNNLSEQHPWLRLHASEIADYIPPEYYNRILKEYAFDSQSDLALFRDYLATHVTQTPNPRALELGPGSGRVTTAFLEEVPNYGTLDLVDLSTDMLDYDKDKFKGKSGLSFVHSDTIDFLSKTDRKYDFVFSLWSFSHSVHQHLMRDPANEAYVTASINKFIEKNMAPQSKLYMIHFDSQSEEQSILFKQWKKEFATFEDTEHQSPSKQILDRVFEEAQSKGLGKASLVHLQGNPIRYDSIEEALEVFMNFHMETYFNLTEKVAEIIDELAQDFTRYQTEDGIFIKPGCFVYTFERS